MRQIVFFNFPGKTPVQFETVFRWTADGKIHLAPKVLGDHPYELQEDPSNGEYPLILISPAINKLISSTMGEYNFPELYVKLHPYQMPQRVN